MAREPTPHEAYLATVAQLVAAGDARALEQPLYRRWLQAKREGYRGLSVKLGEFGRLNATTPPPLDEKDAALIAVCGMSEEQQQAAFSAFLNQLAKVMRKHGIVLPDVKRTNGRSSPSRLQSPNLVSSPTQLSPKRASPKQMSSSTRSNRTRRSASPTSDTDDEHESPAKARERLQRQQAEGRVAERQKRVEERAIAAAKREAEFAEAQAKRDAAKGGLSAGVDVDPPGKRSLELLAEMRRTGQINAAQYEQASIKIKLTTTERNGEDPGPEPQATALVSNRSPKLVVPDVEPARIIVWPELPEPEPSRWSLPACGSPERTRDPSITATPVDSATHKRLRAVVHAGPALRMEPFSCQFDQRVELSCELGPEFARHRGDALICALRRSSSSNASVSRWEPLESSESLRMGRGGRCSVRLNRLGEVQLLWFSSVDHGFLVAVAQMLAQAVLSCLARNRAEPDAAFREGFRLGSVAIVQVSAAADTSAGVRLVGDRKATGALEADVRAAVFEVAERREKEARERAAARAAEAAEAAAATAARAALPSQLREAAKQGKLEDYEVDKEKLQGVVSLLQMGVPVDGVDDKGYTALYVATMYQRVDCVAYLLKAKAEVDKPNKNDVTPLMAAARDGYTEIVKLLLAAGADHFQVDEFGRTADSLADEKGFAETAAAVKEWAAAHPK